MPDPQARVGQLVDKLRERSCRITPQRIAVLRILAESEDHPSVEQIYQQLKVDLPTMSLATVYKTVTLLKEMGELLELGFTDGGNRYDARRPYPHPHLICIQCGRIVDLEVGVLSELPREVIRATSFRILSHRLDFFGVCPQCQHM